MDPLIVQLNSQSENFRQKAVQNQGLVALSTEAHSLFEKLGWPDRKNENWKYTNVKTLLQDSFNAPDWLAPESLALSDQFEILDGRLVGAPKIEGVHWSSLGSGTLNLEELKLLFSPVSDLQDGFQALSLSLPSDILFLDISKDVVLKDPITIKHDYSQCENRSLLQPNIFIRIGEGSEFHICEFINGRKMSFSNGRTTIQVKNNSRLHHVRLIDAEEGFHQVDQVNLDQEKDSFVQMTCFSRGGGLLRNAFTLNQKDSGAESICNGLYLVAGNEHADYRVNMRHLKPYGVSQQLFKGVLKDRSRAVFNGKIYIEKDAQKVDSSQTNSNLVLSKHAEVDSKPELEVYADDVKANHGSAIGQLDDDHLFYLMSRAISREEAIKILARGFVEEVLLKVQSKPLRDSAYTWFDSALVDFQQSLENSKGFLK